MGFLLDHLPPRLHLVIASRADPAMPFAGCGPVANWWSSVADLRFTPEEAGAISPTPWASR